MNKYCIFLLFNEKNILVSKSNRRFHSFEAATYRRVPALIEIPACGKCSKPVKRNQRGIYCEDCTYWYHIKCIDLPINEYQRLSTSSESWYCANCILPIFSNSFFNTEDVEDKSNHCYFRCKYKQTHV